MTIEGFIPSTASLGTPLQGNTEWKVAHLWTNEVVGSKERGYGRMVGKPYLTRIMEGLPLTRPESRCRQGIRFIFIYRGLPQM